LNSFVWTYETARGTLLRRAGKSRHRQIETAQKKCTGLHVPLKPGPEEFEQAIDLQKDPPETARIFGIISCTGSILAKTNWVRTSLGHSPIFTFIRRPRQACSSLSWFHAPTKTGYFFSPL
jgi:hypothetical protein